MIKGHQLELAIQYTNDGDEGDRIERTYILLCFDSVLTPVIFFVQSSYYICNSLLVTTIKIEHFEMIADDRRIGADSIRVYRVAHGSQLTVLIKCLIVNGYIFPIGWLLLLLCNSIHI
jgi:hypothetical protein